MNVVFYFCQVCLVRCYKTLHTGPSKDKICIGLLYVESMQHIGMATCSKQLIVGIILCATDIIEIFEFGEERWMGG